jgi:uncharacterized protein YqjF (DUF2071 family)
MTYGSMCWHRTFIVHWLVPPELLASRIPRGVTLDRWRGHAVASLVATDVEGPAPRALLRTAVAPLFRYRLLNLRTYVDGPAGPGITLLHTRVDRLTYALGARLAGMPYQLDRYLRFDVHASSVELRARGLTVAGLVSDVPSRPLPEGALEQFAAERYRAYAQLPLGRILCVQIAHAPFCARPVSLEQLITPSALGLPVDAAAQSAQLCDEVDVVVEQLALPSEAAAEPSLAPT